MFHIYGGGIVEAIVPQDADGNVIAIVSHEFKLCEPINQGDPFIENYSWQTRKKPGPGWKGFWVNYGMNKIHEVDFWNILDGLECEVVKDEATVQSEELQPIHDYSVGDFVISFENAASVEKRLSEYSKLLKKKKCATKVDFNQVNKNKKIRHCR